MSVKQAAFDNFVQQVTEVKAAIVPLSPQPPNNRDNILKALDLTSQLEALEPLIKADMGL